MTKILNKGQALGLSLHIPHIEAEILLAHILNCKRTDLYINDFCLEEEQLSLLDSFLKRRLSGEPLQYITGKAEFMGMDFIVTKDVLIPRPETELLVNEAVLLSVNKLTQAFACYSITVNLNILELCTGCGNIAISLARELRQAEITVTDISASAIRIAMLNSVNLGARKNITFCKGDLFLALPVDKKNKFDIILCNPPYVKSDEIQLLQREVRFEPEIALDGGKDGLDFYRRLAGSAADYLKPGGYLIVEIGFGQVREIANIFAAAKIFRECYIKKDFAGVERVMCFRT